MVATLLGEGSMAIRRLALVVVIVASVAACSSDGDAEEAIAVEVRAMLDSQFQVGLSGVFGEEAAHCIVEGAVSVVGIEALRGLGFGSGGFGSPEDEAAAYEALLGLMDSDEVGRVFEDCVLGAAVALSHPGCAEGSGPVALVAEFSAPVPISIAFGDGSVALIGSRSIAEDPIPRLFVGHASAGGVFAGEALVEVDVPLMFGGEVVWHPTRGSFFAAPYVFGSSENPEVLYEIGPVSGEIVGSFPLPGVAQEFIVTDPVTGDLIVPISNPSPNYAASVLYRIDPDTGESVVIPMDRAVPIEDRLVDRAPAVVPGSGILFVRGSLDDNTLNLMWLPDGDTDPVRVSIPGVEVVDVVASDDGTQVAIAWLTGGDRAVGGVWIADITATNPADLGVDDWQPVYEGSRNRMTPAPNGFAIWPIPLEGSGRSGIATYEFCGTSP